MFAVETKKLIKKYKEKTAVNGINLSINSGEIYALLGVNGAGKTTTIRMLTCLSTPTDGECFVYGKNCRLQADEVKKIVGISPQDTAVAENLTVYENLEFVCGIYGYSNEKTKEFCGRMIKLFSLEEYKKSRAKTLSGGWKRKLSIAMALIGQPKVLFLDEPTLGLDVLARRELWGVIEKLKGETTIVLTTHYMEEAEQLSDRIGIMIDGELKAEGTLQELEKLFVRIAEKEGKR